ncbi:MAG: hypothetical protein FWG92_01260 [Leptospirales bacterium]|nr:hypothetical protein [Leptospirales bacterium]
MADYLFLCYRKIKDGIPISLKIISSGRAESGKHKGFAWICAFIKFRVLKPIDKNLLNTFKFEYIKSGISYKMDDIV